MALIQSLVSSDKYGVKCPYAMTPKGICVHNTANDASAKNEIAYMKSNNNEVSFHVAIDDVEAIQVIPFNRNAWAAGDGGNGNGNRNYIHVEICYSKSGGTRFTNAEKRAAKEIATLLKQFGWGIDKVKKHQDFSGKYCPHRTISLGWQRFLNMISAELNGTVASTPTANTTNTLYRVKDSKGTQLGAFSKLDNAKSLAQEKKAIVYNKNNKVVISYVPVATTTDEIKRYSEKGVFYPNTKIYFRNAPVISSSNPVVDSYNKGEKVNYDIVVIGNLYNWISWVSSSGIRRYMPIFDKSTKESWGVAK